MATSKHCQHELLAHTFVLSVLCAQSLSHVQLLRPHQAPLSLEFSRQEYWSRLPFPTSGDLSDPEIESVYLVSPALVGGFFTTSATWEAHVRGLL